jgi:hypothetical protein
MTAHSAIYRNMMPPSRAASKVRHEHAAPQAGGVAIATSVVFYPPNCLFVGDQPAAILGNREPGGRSPDVRWIGFREHEIGDESLVAADRHAVREPDPHDLVAVALVVGAGRVKRYECVVAIICRPKATGPRCRAKSFAGLGT